ncbi:hypothetical protein [uncultured Paludibaculum sp.]|uniref:hypothetical protein n=1 Tax=uncultured Paludibaculum sp. TaxID=1765020 RepID=UPI002AABDF6C|nr:hypothetical protein [uncultured Paludibaculum sp.]
MRIVTLFVCLRLLLPAATDGAGAPRKPMRLCAEILSYSLEQPAHEEFVATLEKKIKEYGIGEVMIHGFTPDQWVTNDGFPKVRRVVDAERVAKYRRQLQRFKRLGVKVTLSGPGPNPPQGFFEAYPEARRIASGEFQRYLRSTTAELFRQLPEADCFEIYLWETPFVNDVDFFSGMYWEKTNLDAFASITPHYSRADFLAEMLTAYAQGAQDSQRQFMFLTFSHVPWQEKLIIEALRQMGGDVPILLDHKVQPGDWTPQRPANNVMLNVTDRPAMLLYDGTGEYWGQSLMPYCYPEEIQQRLQHALRNNRSIDSLGMRVHWVNGTTVFGNYNEVNFFALSRLARDPEMPIERIWSEWAEARFGAAAAPKVISALQRTNEIANRFYYLDGIWVQNHSALADLPYLESHFVQFARSMLLWNPADFRAAARIREVTEDPREHTVEWVKADRLEALRLNALSLDDVEAVRGSLAKGEYEKLSGQLRLQRRFIEVAIPHMEAFLRYRIQKQRPSAENARRFEASLAELEAQATAVEREYGEKVVILKAAMIRTYVKQIRAAFPRS